MSPFMPLPTIHPAGHTHKWDLPDRGLPAELPDGVLIITPSDRDLFAREGHQL